MKLRYLIVGCEIQNREWQRLGLRSLDFTAIVS